MQWLTYLFIFHEIALAKIENVVFAVVSKRKLLLATLSQQMLLIVAVPSTGKTMKSQMNFYGKIQTIVIDNMWLICFVKMNFEDNFDN